jgi:hypothetical protein
MRSDMHNELQDQVRDYYISKGWIAIKEHCLRGKKIDVLAQHIKSKYIIGIEIELSAKHSVDNIVRDLEAGCDEVKIISTSGKRSKQIEEKVKKQLNNSLLEKVTFHIADEFIPHLNEKAHFE